MPAFSVTQVSDEQLDEIVEFIEGLEGEPGHGEPNEFVRLHQLMTISAIKADNVVDAVHHLSHIAEVVTGEQLEAIHEAQVLVQAGELHDAEHLIEDLLAGSTTPELDAHQLHLRLALEALALDQEALAALRGGDHHEAEELIEALLHEEHAEPHEHEHDE